MFRKLLPLSALALLTMPSLAHAGRGEGPEAPKQSDETATSEAEAEALAEAVTLDPEVAAAAVQAEASTSASGPADRVRKGRKFALGAVRTIEGLNGITARYYINDNMHVGVNLGVATFSYRYPDPDDAIDCAETLSPDCNKLTRTVAYIGSSAEFIYWFLGKPAGRMPFQADFGLGGRIGFQHYVNSTDVEDVLDDPLQFTFGIPLMIQVNLGENFSLIPEFGVVFRWNPGTRLSDADNPADTNPGFGAGGGQLADGDISGPGFGFEITDYVGVFGGASLLYTF